MNKTTQNYLLLSCLWIVCCLSIPCCVLMCSCNCLEYQKLNIQTLQVRSESSSDSSAAASMLLADLANSDNLFIISWTELVFRFVALLFCISRILVLCPIFSSSKAISSSSLVSVAAIFLFLFLFFLLDG